MTDTLAGHGLALAAAAAGLARLDQALSGHPLAPAFLYRARLEAVRRQAAVDGQAIDPWHLAAMLEGLRLRMDRQLGVVDRGSVFAAARHALDLHQWLACPDPAQEHDIAAAGQTMRAAGAPLLVAAAAAFDWLDQGGARAPLRAALIRHWQRHRLLTAPAPLTAAAALRADVPWSRETWPVAFLHALAGEAGDALSLLTDMERAWFAARQAVAGRRRNSRAGAAVDLLAAAPLLSATTLAEGLGMAVKNAAKLLEEFAGLGIAVEVSHRARRRLYGLSGLTRLRDEVAPPRRPEPGRGRGRPRLAPATATEPSPPPLPPPPLSPIERRRFDYAELDQAMAALDAGLRRARRFLTTARTDGGGTGTAAAQLQAEA